MQTIRPSDERGHANFGWLDSRHSFSFGHYFDPEHMAFGALRVINEDRVDPGAGFDTHGHKDMEIISYVLEGALEHRDSIGTGSVIRPGDVQRMTAGTGIRHSEFNASKTEPLHFLQIWIVPEEDGLKPGYEQVRVPNAEKQGQLRLIASRDGRDGAVTVHQDVDLYASRLGVGDDILFQPRAGHRVWIQLARGSVWINGQTLHEGDGVGLVSESDVRISVERDAEFLLFDLAA